MEIDEKIQKLITEKDHLAYLLLSDMRGDWREIPDEFESAMQKFRETFENAVTEFEKHFGAPSYIEGEYSRKSPGWAPMGLYADWFFEGEDDVLCVFMGGDGNPEDPLLLISGRTKSEARFDSMDPWDWRWIE